MNNLLKWWLSGGVIGIITGKFIIPSIEYIIRLVIFFSLGGDKVTLCQSCFFSLNWNNILLHFIIGAIIGIIIFWILEERKVKK